MIARQSRIVRCAQLAYSVRPVRHLSRGLATLAEDVKSDETFRIPVVDFGKFLKPSSPGDRDMTANEIVMAFKDVGFVYLKNHGIGQDVVDHAFQKSAEFFKLPMEEKAKLAWEDPRSNRGYVAPGRERVTQERDAQRIAEMRTKAPDAKETMEIGRDWDKTWKNQWPMEELVPGFKQTFLSFFKTCHELHVEVMRSIAIGLQLQETYFDDQIQEQYHNLRLLSYPPIQTSLLKKDGQARAGVHSDYGTITFVFQDNVGGLQVQNRHTKQYHAATPIPGTIVVNVADLLARWSNDVLVSTLHRVVAPPPSLLPDGVEITPARRSMAFFCNPNGSATIDCLPSCLGSDGKSKYPPMTTEAYIVSRLKETYV